MLNTSFIVLFEQNCMWGSHKNLRADSVSSVKGVRT